MTTADTPRGGDGWTATVRQRTGLGRLLPPGDPADGAWGSERAAVGGPGSGPVLGRLRIGASGPAATSDPRVAPPGALPPGPLRMEADLSAVSGRPVPAETAALRPLPLSLSAADQDVGPMVSQVDVHVTEALEAPPEPRDPAPVEVRPAGLAAAKVPGVATPTTMPGGAAHPGPGHVRVEPATEPGHRVLDVARAVRAAVADTSVDRPSVVVLVTAVVARDGPRRPSGAFSR
ncbi:hypothetical protein [Streptomyces sp. NPDC056061]|uniref:hypothetical protein n=1 Tax=Streptomyces sp. NPDC056061 TaxID=3345700 RepID=UPI0035E0CCD4